MRRSLDFLLTALVAVFGFLAASFAVHNSDFWLHLAGGRLLAASQYVFGVDPFAFTTANVYWANHAWLFDWLLYLLYAHVSPSLLVVVKALLVSLLAIVLLQVRRRDRGPALPAAGVLLAVLALSPRLLLHSMLLSYLLLGLTLWLLWRARQDNAGSGSQLRRYAPLLLLFGLWANVDAWFLLGPLLAALFWLGDRLRPETPLLTPAWLAPAGLVVCLLNPHHVQSAWLPADVMALPEALRHNVAFEPLAASPWRMSLYHHPLAGINLASCAYLVLLAAGTLSFVLNFRRAPGWRLLVWLAFAALSAWRGRTIPFFVVVAAPITVLNWQDVLAARPKTSGVYHPVVAGVLYSFLSLSTLSLILLAWLGWLQGFGDTGHHVQWVVQPDSSLQRVAEQLRHWHETGRLPAQGRGFLAHPNLVHYCAWFCPEEKGFLDPRLPLFSAVAEPYETILGAVNPTYAPPANQRHDSARRLLREWGITHLVLYEPVLDRLHPALKQLAGAGNSWTLLDVDGQALILGWRDADRLLPEGVPLFDAGKLAFTPSSSAGADSPLRAVPGRGPGRGPRSVDFWSHFGRPAAPSPWPAETAGVLLRYSEALGPRQAQERMGRCFAWSASLPAAAAPAASLVDAPARLMVQLDEVPLALADLTQQPPALPLLAVRAARRAVADNPEDALAYLHLGQAYLALAGRTPERVVLGSLKPLAQLRQVQAAGALENALRRQPDLLPAHDRLAALYESRGFFDTALEHHRAALRLVRRVGHRAGEEARQIEQRAEHVKLLERRVGDARYEFRLSTRQLGSEPKRKAEVALHLGLPRLALEEVLLPSSIVLLGGEGIRLQVELQLSLGNGDAVREELRSSDWQANKSTLGFVNLFTSPQSAHCVYHPAYDWLLLCQAAAEGDYEQADAAWQALFATHVRAFPEGQRALQELTRLQRDAPRNLASEMALSAGSPSCMALPLVRFQREKQMDGLLTLAVLAREQGDLHLLRALLALERGEVKQAEESFRKARMLGRVTSSVLPADGGADLANAYLQYLRAAQR